MLRWLRDAGADAKLAEDYRRLVEENAMLRADRDRWQARALALETEAQQLRAVVARLEARVAELEARLGANSRNSSQPPSSDGPSAPPRPARRRTGRRRGGQEGHVGTTRSVPTIDEADEVHHCVPVACAACGAPLAGEDPAPVGRPVIEIPRPRPRIYWYWLHRLQCDDCGHITQAPAPGAVGDSPFGAGVHALCALLAGRYRLSKRLIREIVGDLCGLSISDGAICAMERRTATALEAPVAEVRGHLATSPAVHADETSWRMGGSKAWLQAAATEKVVSYWTDRRRSSKVVRRMLGDHFDGIVVVDRWSAYTHLRRAYCWAHLLRDFTAMAELYDSPWHGIRLCGCARTVMATWSRWHRGEIERAEMVALLRPVQRRTELYLQWTATRARGSKARAIARELLRDSSGMWLFLEEEAVPPTNNLAERQLRPAVIWRKLSFGNDSEAGGQFVERILTAVGTLRLQRRGVFEYLADAIAAHATGLTPPSLLPSADMT